GARNIARRAVSRGVFTRSREDLDEVVGDATHERRAQYDKCPPGRPPRLEYVVDEAALDDQGQNDQRHNTPPRMAECWLRLQIAYLASCRMASRDLLDSVPSPVVEQPALSPRRMGTDPLLVRLRSPAWAVGHDEVSID